MAEKKRSRAAKVSTHSRLKAAEMKQAQVLMKKYVSTHSRLKAAEGAKLQVIPQHIVSTHSRLKAAENALKCYILIVRFQHTAA